MLSHMRELKSIDLLAVPDSKKIQLIWKIKRQMQQEVLEEKLMRSLLNARVNLQYPETISVAIEDLVRKAVEELKQSR